MVRVKWTCKQQEPCPISSDVIIAAAAARSYPVFVLAGQTESWGWGVGEWNFRLFTFENGCELASIQWVRNCDRLGGSVNLNLLFSRTSTASLWPTFSHPDNNGGENIAELRASGAILSGCPGCGNAHSSSKSPRTIIHITAARGWFLSGISCFNNTSIVIFAILCVKRQSKNICRLSKCIFHELRGLQRKLL